MIFEQIDEILTGRKTQTRRVCKPGEMFCDSPFRYTDKNEDGIKFLNPGVYKVTWFDGQESFDDGDGECKDLRMVYGLGFQRSSWGPGDKWPATYAVQPKRGQPAVWWLEEDGEVGHSMPYVETSFGGRQDITAYLKSRGFRPARIRITAIRRERLQDITEEDARAEGVDSVAEYRELWESINGKTKGARWADNPDVFVLTFELVKEGAA